MKCLCGIFIDHHEKGESDMTTANKLTLVRIALIPVFLGVLYAGFPGSRYVALAVFIIASLTDTLDGYIARKYHLVTDFGKFIDPVADKLLVLTTLVMLVRGGWMEAWVVIIILCRELAVDGLRMVAVGQGKVIAAGPLGKWKTTFQMVTIALILLLNLGCFDTWYTCLLTTGTVLLTLVSAVDYFIRNRSVFGSR
jgi:CDP-diacylglycerol--glycerol-3-phosphate 3-phosphatidyltransferase